MSPPPPTGRLDAPPPPASPLRAAGVSGSPAPASRSRLLVVRALAHLAAGGAETALVDLHDLPADALLARRRDPAVDAALETVVGAQVVVLGTPVYRATYTGQLKAFFDLFPQDALRGRVAGLVVTGAGPGHFLAIDHGLRPLVASLGGLSAARALYVTDAQFPDKDRVPEEIDQAARALAEELRALATGLAGATRERA